MKVTIHQPNFLPYLGLFEKVLYSDVFVIYDTTQFSRDGFQQRNYIKIGNDKHLCSLSVGTSSSWHLAIKDVPIIDNLKTKKMWKTIQTSYSRSPYFKLYEKELEAIFNSEPKTLSDFSIQLIQYFLDKLNWKGRILRSSELTLDTTKRKTDALLEIVQAVGGTVYVSGSSGKNYLEEEKFTQAGIEVVYQSFKPIVYSQRGSDFIPNLAFIDYLFNMPLDELRFNYVFNRKECFSVTSTT